MLIVEFTPGAGIPNAPFGATRADVRRALRSHYHAAPPESRGPETDCYFDNALQFSYEDDDTLSFIEAAAPPPVKVILMGIKTWEIDGLTLLNLLKKSDSVNKLISPSDESDPVFVRTHIALWDLDEQYDRISRRPVKKWGAIGIGDQRYYDAICKIRGVPTTP